MKSCYFLPNNTGTEKFDTINDELKSVLSGITEVISFPTSKVSDFYPESYKNEIPEILFVPTIFDYSNGISYQGVDFALRWYLYFISKKNNGFFKIVLLGTENKSAFFQNCTYSNFLKCPNVEYFQNSYEDISEYLKNVQIKKFDFEDALRKIDLIGIKPPTSYKSHHSIANEWSILRWSKALKIDAESIEELKKIETNVETSLYYQYLETKYPISGHEKVKDRILLNSGKILFIDDELDKGWDVIFRSICRARNYNSFGVDFKGWSKEKIVGESFDMAKNADVVILDLRLHDDDFDEKNSKKITGYEILSKIKEHNKGIQVIVFSATNKIWNLQAILEAGADGFIMKESPEDSLDENFTAQSIESTFQVLDNCLSMSFLKSVNNELNQIKQLTTKNTEYKTFFDSIESDLEISFNLLKDTRVSKKYFNYAFLQLFQVIENFVRYDEVFIDGDDAYVKMKDQEICVQKREIKSLEKSIKFKNGKYEIETNVQNIDPTRPVLRPDTNFKVSAVLIYKYGNSNSSVKKWTEIYTLRNTKAAHYNPAHELDTKDIFMLIEFIKYFIDASNENDANISNGLLVRTEEDILLMLKAKLDTSEKK